MVDQHLVLELIYVKDLLMVYALSNTKPFCVRIPLSIFIATY